MAMKRIYVSITQRGQITLPAEVRQRFGLKPRDKVIFEIDDDQVRVTRPEMTLEETFGSLKPRRPIADIDAAIREAKEEKVARDLKR
jgi:AbrB family looped-hinge helix DNA binding protein